MAGHSKWKNIQHRKGAQDKKRGKIFTKILKEVTVAVKTGGGPEAESNPRLRAALQNAKANNVPKDTIERAIKKASGADAENFVESTFEGYGPEGVGIFVEVATDNNTRTVANIRSYFNRYQGNLGKNGCLEFIFDRQGQFLIPLENIKRQHPDWGEDEFTMALLDYDVDDVDWDEEEGMATVSCSVENFGKVAKAMDELEIECAESGLNRIPNNTKSLSEESFPSFMKLIDALEDDDDVQKVYHNVEFDEALIEKFS